MAPMAMSSDFAPRFQAAVGRKLARFLINVDDRCLGYIVGRRGASTLGKHLFEIAAKQPKSRSLKATDGMAKTLANRNVDQR